MSSYDHYDIKRRLEYSNFNNEYLKHNKIKIKSSYMLKKKITVQN